MSTHEPARGTDSRWALVPGSPADRWLRTVRELLGHELAGSIPGTPPDRIDDLRSAHPAAPPTLLALLAEVDGAAARDAGDRIRLTSAAPFALYLSSAQEIAELTPLFAEPIAQGLAATGGDRSDPDVLDPRIDASRPLADRLLLAACANGGATATLWIDGHPGPGGTAGQIIEYTHDPDRYRVIARDLDALLSEVADPTACWLGIG